MLQETAFAEPPGAVPLAQFYLEDSYFQVHSDYETISRSTGSRSQGFFSSGESLNVYSAPNASSSTEDFYATPNAYFGEIVCSLFPLLVVRLL